MERSPVEINIADTPLVSFDGIAEFTSSTGTFAREYGSTDTEPLRLWEARSRQWIQELRSRFAERLRHAAVISKYRFGQFHAEQGWPPDEPHALDGLCVDDTYRRVTIDDPRQLIATIEKNENDATTSSAFMKFIRLQRRAVLIGVTTTSCIAKTVRSLIPEMEAGRSALEEVILARNGVAARKKQAKNARRILDEFSQHTRVRIVRSLNDIHWI